MGLEKHAEQLTMKCLLLLLAFLLVLIFNSCNTRDCNNIPQSFSSYEEASKILLATNFQFADNVNTSKSSWISSASYYSCDGKVGYFIITANARTYIHAGMPIEVWQQFKVANSFGSFYDSYIRNRYTFTLASAALKANLNGKGLTKGDIINKGDLINKGDMQ